MARKKCSACAGFSCPARTRRRNNSVRPLGTKRIKCSLDYKPGGAFTGTNPMRAQTQARGTFRGTFRLACERPSPIREIQASIARALQAHYEPPQFVPEPLASLLSQLVRGEGEGD